MKISAIKYGASSLGQPLNALTVGSGRRGLLITSAMHGDEVEGVILGTYLWEKLAKIQLSPAWRIMWVPIYNPDGFTLGQRWSARAVDLNRNFPTKKWNPVASNPRYPPGKFPASEPETVAFMRLIKRFRPELILDLHSFSKSAVLLDFSEAMGDLDRMAKRWARSLNIPAKRGGFGYEEYGCAYQWVNELGIPSITLEVKKNLSREAIQKRYLGETFKFLKRFLEKT